MSKHSQDYQNLMRLLHDEGWSIQKVELKIDNPAEGSTEHSKFTLKKGKEINVLESTEDDLGLLSWHFHWFPNVQNKNEFRKVKNLERYYDEIQFLVDPDGAKLRAASVSVAKGEFKLTYRIEELLDGFLNEKSNASRSSKKYLKLKTDYYFILLYHLDLLGRIKPMLDRYNTDGSNFKHYNDLLLQRTMEYVKSDKPIQKYQKLIEVLDFDPADKMSIYSEIEADNNEVFGMIQSHYGKSADAMKVIPRLLDMYRRFAEFSADYIQFFSRIEHSLAGKKYDANWGYSENFSYLLSIPHYASILKCLDPNIRHSESHLNTKTGKLDRIIITDKNGRRRKILREYTYQEFSEMLKDLDNALSLAFTMAVISAYVIILQEVLTSFDYKVLLLGIDNRN